MTLPPDAWRPEFLGPPHSVHGRPRRRPELRRHEHRTDRPTATARVGAGYEVTDGVGGSAVAGLPRDGAGPAVVLRAGMDALRVREGTGLPCASREYAGGPDGARVPVAHARGRRSRRSVRACRL